MNAKDAESLALDLLSADSEQQVIDRLRKARLWDDAHAWRLFGDRDSNFATIGNQQSRPEAALVEKIINCVDTRLLNECLVRGIDPESASAPKSLREAIATFFEGRQIKGELHGKLEDWERPEIQAQEQLITLAVTGAKPPQAMPSITIVDNGEGQTPARMPDTFLSIDRNNKLRIPFVQGKFNMGGTGALKFCGSHSIQLIISRRNPEILTKWRSNSNWGSNDPRGNEWSFTVVRRERPTGSVGEVRNSVFRYLAPVGADTRPTHGELLSFRADCILAMPDGNRAYVRPLKHGSVIKLFEYDMKGFASNALMPDGLLSRLEILLPQIALPVRVHECRSYRGDPSRSFANTLVGVVKRLRDNQNIEPGYPSSASLTVKGERFTAQIYAFTKDRADTYRSNEGIIFTVNGQTHGAIPKTFFERSKVKMQRLARSLIVIVDCSGLSVGAREDLFMNSRDRLSNGELRKALEQELEEMIGKHAGLRDLRERRRNQEIAERIQDSKPLESVLESILKSSPTLTRLFILGQRLSRPRRADTTEGGEGSGGGEAGAGLKGPFVGLPHPTFFRFHNKKDGEELRRGAELGRRCRIRFDTDVENGYFERSQLPGRYDVQVLDGLLEGIALDHNVTLFNGIANWSIELPSERLSDGDKVTLALTVNDETLVDPFVNVARVAMHAKRDGEGQGGDRKSRGGGGATGGDTGSNGTGGDSSRIGENVPGGIALPPIIEVKQGDANWVSKSFEDVTACKVIDDGDSEAEAKLTFYINVDNPSLKLELKDGKDDVALTKQKFIWANVLIGLALLHDDRLRRPRKSETDANGQSNVYETIEGTSRALAPFLVPMINYLGSLTTDGVTTLGQSGDEE